MLLLIPPRFVAQLFPLLDHFLLPFPLLISLRRPDALTCLASPACLLACGLHVLFCAPGELTGGVEKRVSYLHLHRQTYQPHMYSTVHIWDLSYRLFLSVYFLSVPLPQLSFQGILSPYLEVKTKI
jgi:hypothetical protein